MIIAPPWKRSLRQAASLFTGTARDGTVTSHRWQASGGHVAAPTADAYTSKLPSDGHDVLFRQYLGRRQ